MTRENKLALVVGFGLILLVGILVSDHFSAARNQEPAELSQALDPLSATRVENPELIALRAEPSGAPGIDLASLEGRGENRFGNGFGNPSVNGTGAGINNGQSGNRGSEDWNGGFGSSSASPSGAIRPDYRHRAVDPVVPDSVAGIEMGAGGGIGLTAAEAERLPYTFHHVRKNENLSEICNEHYGDASLARALARFNELKNPDAIQAGQRLQIPRADDLVRGRTAATPPGSFTTRSVSTRSVSTPPAPRPKPADRPRATGPRTPTANVATYTVKEGDVLTEIASTLLGSARKYHAIFEANRDQLDSPDDIRAGMTLRIPR